jgi:hypothetical protein
VDTGSQTGRGKAYATRGICELSPV